MADGVQFIKCRQFSLEMNSKELYRSSGKEKESDCLVLLTTSSPVIFTRARVSLALLSLRKNGGLLVI